MLPPKHNVFPPAISLVSYIPQVLWIFISNFNACSGLPVHFSTLTFRTSRSSQCPVWLGFLNHSIRAFQWAPHQLLPSTKGCFLHMGIGQHPFCVVHSVMTYLANIGKAPGLLLLLQNGQPLSCTCLTNRLYQIMTWAIIAGNPPSQSFPIGAATVAASQFQIISKKLWVTDLAIPISST